MIECPGRVWVEGEMPRVSLGYTIQDVQAVVHDLHAIARRLRHKRFANGALRLDQIKIAFNLDDETKLPNGFYAYELRDSNRLIEEFMLLANMAVAHRIYQAFPDLALLRRHPPPIENALRQTLEILAENGVHLDAQDSGALHDSILRFVSSSSSDGAEGGLKDDLSSARLQVITAMCSRPMQFARYFCTGSLRNEKLFHHYALNVPLYTHFTSPIRRYPDVLVHRLLAAAVDPQRHPRPAFPPEALERQAQHCNDAKQTAKTLSELSAELFLGAFIDRVGELEEPGMVMAVLDRSVDVLLLRLGVVKRVYMDKQPGLAAYAYAKDYAQGARLTLTWMTGQQQGKEEKGKEGEKEVVRLFALLTVRLTPSENNKLKSNAVIVKHVTADNSTQ